MTDPGLFCHAGTLILDSLRLTCLSFETIGGSCELDVLFTVETCGRELKLGVRT